MDTSSADNKIISLSRLIKMVNNVSLENDIVAFEVNFPEGRASEFPLRVDALLIVLTEQGTGRIGIDLREYDVHPGQLLLIQPRNYICFTETSGDCKARVVACARDTIESIMPKMTDILPLMLHHRSVPLTDPTPAQAQGLRGFYDFLRGILRGGKTPFLRQKVLAVLQAAIYEMMDITRSNTGPDYSKSRKEELMGNFLIKLAENFRHDRQVNSYAAQLCVSSKHLSSVVKEISGHTAGQWIERYVVLEAKVLLQTTDLSVQQISARLNFPDQSSFGKYFKHITGMSPSTFRKQQP